MHTAVRHASLERILHICILHSTGTLYCATSRIHTASCLMCTEVNRRGRGVHISPSPAAEVRDKWNYASVPRVYLHGVDTGHVAFLFLPSTVRVTLHWDPLRGGRSGDRIPVAARFFAPFQNGPGAHTASFTVGTGSLFPGVKRHGRGFDHSPPSSAEVKERVKVYIPLLPFWNFMSCSRVNFIL